MTPETMATAEDYSVPSEAARILKQGILENPTLRSNVPRDAGEFAKCVHFEGNSSPSIPVNWRFAESISSLKGLEAIWLNALLRQKYSQKEPVHVNINT